MKGGSRDRWGMRYFFCFYYFSLLSFYYWRRHCEVPARRRVGCVVKGTSSAGGRPTSKFSRGRRPALKAARIPKSQRAIEGVPGLFTFDGELHGVCACVGAKSA